MTTATPADSQVGQSDAPTESTKPSGSDERRVIDTLNDADSARALTLESALARFANPDDLREVHEDLTRMMMAYKFGLDEIMTKVNILEQEFTHIHAYNPIEHVTSRLKTPSSIIEKADRLGIPTTVASVRDQIHDIAGVRIVCSFIEDIRAIQAMIANQRDITVREVKDYISNPKPSGYRSLHLILETPVHLSDRVENVVVEVQLRSIAMDFWASLEHKINYKFSGDIPDGLRAELTEAAAAAHDLDVKMQSLHHQVGALPVEDSPPAPWSLLERLPFAAEALRAATPEAPTTH